ncbi:hypothetical protein [Amycolatopsis anabasis]|uniref:hypothetical protein n=1 Tax=Amycolatopsis anabasis TaxID=1840409 RepID=UPI00131E9628|nr:hypothetical protein [Amycolatopsis anabasis]
MKRILALAALATAGFFATATGAQAAPEPAAGQPSGADVASAHSAAADPAVQATLGKFFAQGGGQQRAAVAQAPAVTVDRASVAVYELSKDFVAGVAGAPAGTLAYLAVPARAADGQVATLWTVRAADGAWQVGNIASGDREAKLAAALPAGALLLHEPQVDAWYAQRDGRVTLLDAGVSGRPVGEVTALADYQRAVSQRYGDKLAGSDYARQGAAGGYAGTVLREDNAAVESGTGWTALLVLGAGLVVVGAAAFLVRSSRTART